MLLQRQFGCGSDTKPTAVVPDPALTASQQRRLRRMISNRESARRSRLRKQKHLEVLRCHVSRMRDLNRQLAGRVGLVLNQTVIVRSDNDRLRYESNILIDRFSKIQRFLELQRLCFPLTGAVCGGFGSGNDQQTALASLIA